MLVSLHFKMGPSQLNLDMATKFTILVLICSDLVSGVPVSNSAISISSLSTEELIANVAINQLAVIQLLGESQNPREDSLCHHGHDDINQLRSDIQETHQELNNSMTSLEVNITALEQKQEDAHDVASNKEKGVNETLVNLDQTMIILQDQVEQQGNTLDSLVTTNTTVNYKVDSLEHRLISLQNEMEQQQLTLENKIKMFHRYHYDEGGAVLRHEGHNFYIRTGDLLSWDDARSWCQTHLGTDLAHPTGNLTAFVIMVTEQNRFHVWLGASDRAEEGDWVWVDGTKINSDFPWGTGEPNNVKNEHCLETIGSRDIFNDDQCAKLNKFVCQ